MSATRATMRTRLVMAGAFAGAMALLALSVVFSWPVPIGGPASSAADEAAAAFDSPSGTCLDWPVENPRAMRRLDCAQPHVFEVTSNVEISAEYPASTPPPDEKTWQEIANAKCTAGVATYLGGKLDPFGKYTVSALKPTDEQWRSGDRKLRCGVHRVTSLGTRLRTTGSAAKQDQSNIHDVGTCLELKENAPGDPADCSTAHAFEIVGTVDLATAFPAEYGSLDAQKTKLAELCGAAASQYSGGADLAAKGLIVTWDTLPEESWAAGSRRVDCKVGALLPDGSGLAPVTGSVRAQPLVATPPPPSTPGG